MLWFVCIDVVRGMLWHSRGGWAAGETIIHICSGDMSLMPELKRDQEVREEELIKREEKRGGKFKFRLLFCNYLLSCVL